VNGVIAPDVSWISVASSTLPRVRDPLLFHAKCRQEGERLDMYLLGRAALVLHFAFPLATADVDIVWMRDSGLEQKAIDLVRKGSPLAEALAGAQEQVGHLRCG
jgi:hypothetical protein